MARQERQKHQQLYPGWTARDNYAIHQRKKKKKRDKSADGGKVLSSLLLFLCFSLSFSLSQQKFFFSFPSTFSSFSPHSPSFSVSVVSSFSLVLSFPTLLTEGGSLKKCRARFGLDQQSKWCKPCRYVMVMILFQFVLEC